MRKQTVLWRISAVSAFLSLALMLAAVVPAGVSGNGVGLYADTTDVTLRHATGSSSNPYVQITVSAAGAFNGHLGGDHQDGRDIIPQFTFQGMTYSQNFDAAGQAIFNAGCKLAAPTATATGTLTATATPVNQAAPSTGSNPASTPVPTATPVRQAAPVTGSNPANTPVNQTAPLAGPNVAPGGLPRAGSGYGAVANQQEALRRFLLIIAAIAFAVVAAGSATGATWLGKKSSAR